jgi:hypothetical protein
LYLPYSHLKGRLHSTSSADGRIRSFGTRKENAVQTAFVPILLIALAIPLILQKIPRNGFYGFRTPYTLSSDDV